ncbi:restriction endonuclease [Alkalihalobacillus trypoxylicola]|nr:restriction endonuclease [Alkalihalobacillus trypoxylicola]
MLEELWLLGIISIILLVIVILIGAAKLKQKKYDLQKISMKDIDRMSGYEFEDYLYVLLAAIGIETLYITKKSRDFGADLIFESNDGVRIAVQAKRYSDKLGLKAVQEIHTACSFYQANKGLIITNSSQISDPCYQLAAATQVGIIDRDGLQAIIQYMKKGKMESAYQMILEATSGQHYQNKVDLELFEIEQRVIKAGEFFYRR